MKKLLIIFSLLGTIGLQADYFTDATKAYLHQNYKKAFKLYKKSCDAGNPVGCEHLGALYYDGRGVQQNYLKAKELFKKACDGNYTFACKKNKAIR